MKLTKLFVLSLFIISSLVAQTQNYSTLRTKTFIPLTDSTFLDSLIIVPQSEIIFINREILPNKLYQIEYSKSIFISSANLIEKGDPITITYRVFVDLTTKDYFHRNSLEIVHSGPILAYPKNNESQNRQSFFADNQLDKRGSISRGIVIGNNQDASVSSNLNLQIAGKLGDNLNILAAISDENIPIQPDGNSQQLQEFDKVFIQLYNEKTKLIAGDFELYKPEGYFLNVNRKGQGGLLNTKIKSKKNSSLLFETTLSGAVAKGKYCRKMFNGQEGNQGPYKLTGCENELYIIILAGSESVFIDGKQKTRGKENDYIIDYNTGEIIFTANSPITKDNRIAVEFEYSEKSYARFMISSSNVLKSSNSSFWINIFSEHDSKNQPLAQDLNDEQKLLLSQTGDNIENAFIPNVDSTAFSTDYVLYQKKDTSVNGLNYLIYEYSTDASKAFYKVGFSQVGANKGNYIHMQSAANGKVYKWIAPVDGRSQGNYEPIRLLITPKSKQLLSIGGINKIGRSTKTFYEIALSNSDLNTFSNLDQSDDVGYAIKLGINKQLLNRDTLKNALSTSLNYEFLQTHFEAFERFRSVEFERDWNFINQLIENQHFLQLDINYKYKNTLNSGYEFAILNNGRDYQGNKNNLFFNTKLYGFALLVNTSLLSTESDVNTTQFIRYSADLSKSTKYLKIGTGIESENNKWINSLTDSILNNSFRFSTFRFYLENNDSTINKYSASYSRRGDYIPKNNSMAQVSQAEDFQIGFGLIKNPKNNLRTKVTYRKLDILDTSLISQPKQNTLTGRLEYNFTILNGALSSYTFYEAGSGLEPKRDYSYLRVTNGQGIYTWNDYNNNGIAELDEFELSQFQDQANFIRIFSPGNDYIKTYQNEFSEILNIKPIAVWRSKSGIRKFFTFFSNQFAYMVNQKSSNDNLLESLNPFDFSNKLSELITINRSLRNTLSFKNQNSKLGADFIYQQNNNRILLSNGFDDREKELHGLRLRWQFLPDFTFINYSEKASKEYYSEFFSSKNYFLSILSNDITVQYMPGFKTKIELIYKYIEKENRLSVEQSYNNTFGIELNYGITGKGTLQIKGDYSNIVFNASKNTSMAYEMLEGLKPGNNAIWRFGYQQKFAGNIELSILYNGRYSETLNIIHTGSIQLRAFF